MARSHHRKKHKEHLRQFKHRDEAVVHTPKGRASAVFAIGGAVIGLAVSYFATEGSWLWMIIGTVVGCGLGYFIGRKTDES